MKKSRHKSITDDLLQCFMGGFGLSTPLGAFCTFFNGRPLFSSLPHVEGRVTAEPHAPASWLFHCFIFRVSLPDFVVNITLSI